jgi:alpha-beta hydrolase superfamily lysophospholipase
MEQIFELHSADGLRLHLHSWHAPQPDKVMVIVHGLGGHAGFYRDSVAPYLTTERVTIYAPDLRGHGRSAGMRGDIEDFEHLLRDVQAAVTFARQRHPDLPLILLGESMGTPLAITYAANSKDQHRPDGLILAACVVAPTIKPRLDEIFRTSYYFLTNRQKIAIPITGREEQGVRDPEFVQVLKTDPMFNRRVSVRFLLQMTGHMNQAARLHDHLTMPVLLMQGGKDCTVRHRATRAFFERIAATDKEMHVFPEAFHAILNDPDSPQVRATMLRWLERVVNSKEPLHPAISR